MKIPLEVPEELIFDILPIAISSLDYLPPVAAWLTGTGFMLGDGVLATCWHCIEQEPPERHWYGATRLKPGPSPTSVIGLREKVATDLGWARVNFRATLGFRLSSRTPRMGEGVWTFGYPLSERIQQPSGVPIHRLHPRFMHGYIMREFIYKHPALGDMPSWELSFPSPEGLSGAPLFAEGTLDIVGMMYGNNEVSLIEEFAAVDTETGGRRPEVQRIVTFGLAHHLSVLRPLADKHKSCADAQFIPND